ncbi:MAG: hypothetical protein K8L91_14115 [Anaerolineae bacterium]|nr:hypothetical protein [Anaerolineae bacterium]
MRPPLKNFWRLVGIGLCIVFVLALMVSGTYSTRAQDAPTPTTTTEPLPQPSPMAATPTSDAPPLSTSQLALLSQIDAANLDQSNWQTYRVVSFNNVSFVETLTNPTDGSILSQRQEDTNSLITTDVQGDIRTPNHLRSALMTVERIERSSFSAGTPTTEQYTLVVEARYVNNRLYVQALRTGGSESLPAMPPAGWTDITDNPDQFPALVAINMRQYVPSATQTPGLNPLTTTDWVSVVQNTPLRDLIADIRLEQPETFLEGPFAGQTFNKIIVQLDPAAVMRAAFASRADAEVLIAVFVNEGVDMSLTIWLDQTNSRRVREQYVFVIQGNPTPESFGYAPGDIGEGSLINAIFSVESDLTYTANAPVKIEVPQ